MTETPLDERPRLGVMLGARDDREAAEFEEVAAIALAGVAGTAVPSPGMRAAVMHRVDTPQPRPAATVTPLHGAIRSRRSLRPSRRRAPLWLAAAAAVMLIVGGVGASLTAHRSPTHEASRTLATVSAAHDVSRVTSTFSGGSAHVAVVSSASVGRSVAVITNAPDLAADRTYELWFYRGGRATSAGTFTPSGSGHDVVTLTGTYRSHDFVAATVERSPAPDQPTTPPVFEVAT
jgi:hypothetical protein